MTCLLGSTPLRSLNLGFLVSVGLALTASTVSAEDFPTFLNEEIKFQSVPDLPGLAVAVLIGNPDEEGAYLMRVRFAAGTLTPPHTHDRDRTVTVIEGTWSFGNDATGTCENTKRLGAGSVAVHPAGKVHYDGSCSDESVIVQIEGQGPVKTNFLGVPTEQ